MLGNLFPDSRVLSGADATRAAFSEAARAASFIHIATHANFRQDNPMFSSFKLADGYVTAMDLFSMSCQTNMVALSGCQSGLAEVSGSDDLLGLVRGFLYAGARSLLLSLWSVNDQSTALLMAEFYKEWRGLKRAKLFRPQFKGASDLSSPVPLGAFHSDRQGLAIREHFARLDVLATPTNSELLHPGSPESLVKSQRRSNRQFHRSPPERSFLDVFQVPEHALSLWRR